MAAGWNESCRNLLRQAECGCWISDATSSDSIAQLLIFSVPVVVLGGQTAPYPAARLPEPVLIRGLAALFMVTGVFLTGEVILGGL